VFPTKVRNYLVVIPNTFSYLAIDDVGLLRARHSFISILGIFLDNAVFMDNGPSIGLLAVELKNYFAHFSSTLHAPPE